MEHVLAMYYVCTKFPALSMEKIKAGIFDGPQIRQLINDHKFQSSMNDSLGNKFNGQYRGPWNIHMMEDYCWSIQRKCPRSIWNQCIEGNNRNDDSVTKWKKINEPNATYV